MINDYDLYIFDLDGVIYAGNILIPNADLVIKKLQKKNKKIYFLTNNSTKTREDFIKKLKDFNININLENIITSAYATAYYLNNKYPKKKKIFVIGQNGIKKELKNFNFKIIEEYNSKNVINFVIVGLDQFFNYKKLTIAYHYLLQKAKFIATNDDPSLPSENLPLPGAGSMVKALEICSGISPEIIIGKPNSFMINLILKKEKIDRSKTIMIGDRLSTDILAGINSKIDTLLVKTGSGLEELNNEKLNHIKPNYVINSVEEII